MFSAVIGRIKQFCREQSGVAFNEYLLLLALLTGAVIAAILLMSGEMAATWESWAFWISTEQGNLSPP